MRVQLFKFRFCVALLLTLTGVIGTNRASAAESDTPAPQLIRDLKGKVVLLDFWASWCAPCRQSFPWMSELQKRYAGSEFVVIAVNLDQERALADRFLKATPAGFRVEYDPNGLLATGYDVTVMPTSVLIDRNGRVRERHKGFRIAEAAARETSLVKLLKE